MLKPEFIEQIKQAGNYALELHKLDTTHGEMSDPETIQKWMDGMMDYQDKLSDIVNPWSFSKYETAYEYVVKLFSPEESIIIRREWESSRRNVGDIIKRKLRNWFKRK